MENDNSFISLEGDLIESMIFSVFQFETTNNDEHISLGESRPWKLVNTKLYLEKKIPQFSIQPTEINRHNNVPLDVDKAIHFIYFAVDTVHRQLIDEIILDTQINF